LTGAAYRIAWGGVHNDGARGSRGTGEHEWFTPIVYIEAARLALGAIDLDPASHAYAQAYVRAEAFHTVEDDGLAQEWHGRVWLNPPYGREVIGLFVNKLIEELGNGRTTAAIMLTHNYTDTEWFHAAARYATALCFTLGRVKFVDSNGEPANPTQGQVFFYYGADTARFAENFARFGLIVNPAPGNTGWGRLSCGDAAGFSAPRRSASTTPASAGGG
jgi:ParB family chromosome partitioning protein